MSGGEAYHCWNCGEAMYRTIASEGGDEWADGKHEVFWRCLPCGVKISQAAAEAYLRRRQAPPEPPRDLAGAPLAAGDRVVFVDDSRGFVSLHVGPVKEVRGPHEVICSVIGSPSPGLIAPTALRWVKVKPQRILKLPEHVDD